MKCRILVFNRANALPHFNLCGKLLFDFTLKGGFWAFPFFDFSAGEFPPALPVPVTSLGVENLSTALGRGTDNYGSGDDYGFHIEILSCNPS